jgi:hypothetical protein
MAGHPFRVGIGVAAAGVAILVAVLIAITVILGGGDPPVAQPGPVGATLPAQPETVAEAAPKAVVPAACGFDPLIQASGAGDGKFDADAALAGPRPPTSKAFVTVADEMVAQRRWHDAEVALIAACRAAAAAAGAPTVPVASAQARLARFYLDYARLDAEGPRPELRVRAQDLLASSASTYESVLGKDASRTRMAARQAAALAQGRTEPLPSQSRTDIMGGSVMSSSEDIAQMHEDLGRLHAQAASVTNDPAGFRRRAAQAEARRLACRDEACQRRWYAERRRQLFDEF